LLSDQLKIERDPLKAFVLNALLKRADLMQMCPFETLDALNTKITRWRNLPTVAFRQIGSAYAESTGSFEQLDETVYPLGGDVDIDKVYMKDKSAIVNPRDVQVQMKVEAMAFKFNNAFVAGDQAVDANSFTGITKRVANLPAAQTLSMGANGLDIRASNANMFTFLDKIDATLYRIGAGKDPENVTLFMNDNTFLNITSVAKRLNMLEYTQDMFERFIPTYRGAKLVDIGYTDETEATRIITQTETQGSSSVATSIYAVRFGGDGGEFLHGIEEYPLDVQDIGWLPTAPTYRVRVDWPVGLALWNDRSIARLNGIVWTT
jgi:hypothetical protein